MTFKKLLGLSLVLMFAVSTVTMTSCTKKKGCTNKQSDNYDSEAEEDDGTCKAWSEKFVGDYSIQLGCVHPVLASALNSPFDMTVSAINDTDVSLLLKTAALGDIPLSGSVNKDILTFNEFKVDTFRNSAGLEMHNLVINGSATYNAATNLEGSISVATSFINLTQAGADDNCSLVATRK